MATIRRPRFITTERTSEPRKAGWEHVLYWLAVETGGAGCSRSSSGTVPQASPERESGSRRRVDQRRAAGEGEAAPFRRLTPRGCPRPREGGARSSIRSRKSPSSERAKTWTGPVSRPRRRGQDSSAREKPDNCAAELRGGGLTRLQRLVHLSVPAIARICWRPSSRGSRTAGCEYLRRDVGKRVRVG